MTYEEWLNNAIETLANAGNATARLDAQLLLAAVTYRDRSFILAHTDELLGNKQLQVLGDVLQRRKNGEPIAYIVGKKEFYGRDFIVSKDVLIPRPESETFIELLKEVAPKSGQTLIDTGTGSGALALSVKKEFPSLAVTATDVSKKALRIAKNNADILRADIQFVQSDLFTNINESFDYIIANLPYVPTVLDVSKEVLTEPSVAVFSGTDGLDCIREFIPQATKHLNPDGYIFIESLLSQHEEIIRLCSKQGLVIKQTSGLVQLYQLTI